MKKRLTPEKAVCNQLDQATPIIMLGTVWSPHCGQSITVNKSTIPLVDVAIEENVQNAHSSYFLEIDFGGGIIFNKIRMLNGQRATEI